MAIILITAAGWFFPGSGSRTEECAFPASLPGGNLQQLIDIRVTRSESLPAGIELEATVGEDRFRTVHWRERVQSSQQPQGRFADG